MDIKIDGFIDDMPYNLSAHENNEIIIFTKKSIYDNFVEKNGKDPGDKTNYYTIKINTSDNLNKITEKSERIISSYIPKSDYYISNDNIKEAMDAEQLRNEHLLNSAIQLILIMIALSNAYNSFRINLRTRKRDFKLLNTAGMTEKQIRSMVYEEAKILLIRIILYYIFVLALIIFLRSYRSQFDLKFAIKEILFNLNFIPIIITFIFIIIGVLLAVYSSIKNIYNEHSNILA